MSSFETGGKIDLLRSDVFKLCADRNKTTPQGRCFINRVIDQNRADAPASHFMFYKKMMYIHASSAEMSLNHWA